MPPGASTFDIEAFLNSLIQRLFPAWYANQAVREMPLHDMGSLNPNSFLSHRWLSMHSVIQAMQGSLENAGPDWQELHQLLGKLIVEKDYQRHLSVSVIHGVEYSTHEEEFPNILSYAEHALQQQQWQQEWQTTEQFEHHLLQAFPQQDIPHRMVYREWDGRYYWLNKEEPVHLAAVLMHCQHKQRDARISASINVESLHLPTLDAIRSKYWLILMQRDDAYQVLQLLDQAGFGVIPCEFEWRRSDLLILAGRKSNRKLNNILLSLQNNRSSQQVTDLGRYLSRHYYPFRNQ